MALTREQSQIWQAMNVGVQWVLRDGVDPLAPEPKPAVLAVHASAEAAPAAVSPSATISAGSASAVPAMVRRGPMATRLRRQQAAVDIQTASPAFRARRTAGRVRLRPLRQVLLRNLHPSLPHNLPYRSNLR